MFYERIYCSFEASGEFKDLFVMLGASGGWDLGEERTIGCMSSIRRIVGVVERSMVACFHFVHLAFDTRS